MIYQLRVYEIFDRNKGAFHDRFRDHAVRIMETYGFEFVSIWEASNSGRTELVYLLEWPDEEAMREAWTGFMEDQEWKDIKRDWAAEHGQAVGEISEKVLVPTGYGPS